MPRQLTLLEAVIAGDIARVNHCLLLGADVHKGDSHQDSPLMAAIVHNNPAMVKILLDAGAAPFRPNASGHTALDMAVWQGNSGIIQALADAGADMSTRSDGFTPLMCLAQLGYTDSVEVVLKHVPAESINSTGDVGQTALILACAENQAGAAKALVDAGADVTVRDEDGTTALHLAAESGNLQTMRTLMRAGADPVCQRDWGKRTTPLHIAAANGRTSAARELLLAGAQPSARDARGMTPLHTAASLGHSAALAEIVTALEARQEEGQLLRSAESTDATLAAHDKKGKTALHYAAELLHLTSAMVLLRAGLPESVQNARGKCPSALDSAVDIVHNGVLQAKDPARKACMARILARGPALRARSWRWPAGGKLEARGVCGKSTTTAARVFCPKQGNHRQPALTKAMLR